VCEGAKARGRGLGAVALGEDRGRVEAVEQADGAEGLAGVEQAFKGDGTPRAGAIVEEDGDGAAFVELCEVGGVWCRRTRWGFAPRFQNRKPQGTRFLRLPICGRGRTGGAREW